jgi:hydroxyacylglutathione hydrolase
MTKIKKFTFNLYQENTYVLYDDTGECVIVDPGCCNAQEENELRSFIHKQKLKPVFLLNTHCHIDHVLEMTLLSVPGKCLSSLIKAK